MVTFLSANKINSIYYKIKAIVDILVHKQHINLIF